MGAPCTPQGGEKIFRRNLQERFVSAPKAEIAPRGRERVNFRTFFVGRGRCEGSEWLIYSSFSLRFQKGSSTCIRKKCTPEKILVTLVGPWDVPDVPNIFVTRRFVHGVLKGG